jgi:hypothetical protein
MLAGQINRGSKLGEAIYNLAKNPEVKTIVEIGTWNGCGSTKCILDGVLESGKRKEVISLECNKLRHEEAKINLGFIPPTFKLIHGTIVTAEELIPILPTLENDTLKGWLTEDINWIKNTPYVLDRLPERIDLLIIDGGEFSGGLEFSRLHGHARFIILDDTNAIKHKSTKDFIKSKPTEFRIIEDNITDRNGYLICEHV